MWYKIDYDKLAILLLPTFLRTPILVAFVQCILSEIDKIHYRWLQEREKQFYKLEHTGQVCKLRKVLNDNCDKVLRRILIGPGNSFAQEYIWTESEPEAQWLDDTLFVYTENEYVNTGVDFIVTVPKSVFNDQEFRLIDFLKFYKLAGKRYEFILIE